MNSHCPIFFLGSTEVGMSLSFWKTVMGLYLDWIIKSKESMTLNKQCRVLFWITRLIFWSCTHCRVQPVLSDFSQSMRTLKHAFVRQKVTVSSIFAWSSGDSLFKNFQPESCSVLNKHNKCYVTAHCPPAILKTLPLFCRTRLNPLSPNKAKTITVSGQTLTQRLGWMSGSAEMLDQKNIFRHVILGTITAHLSWCWRCFPSK